LNLEILPVSPGTHHIIGLPDLSTTEYTLSSRMLDGSEEAFRSLNPETSVSLSSQPGMANLN